MELSEELLVDQVSKREFLWNKKDALYKNKLLKKTAWNNISGNLNCKGKTKIIIQRKKKEKI